jgi:hypothetical protein
MPKPNPALKKSGLNLDITGAIINNNEFEKRGFKPWASWENTKTRYSW